MFIPIRTFEIATELIDSLADLDSPQAYPGRVLPALAEMIGCDVITYNEIGPTGVRYADWPPGALDRRTEPIFAHFVHQHPVIRHFRATADPQALTIDDFLSMSEFRRLGLYADFFRPIPVNHQLSISLTNGGAPVVGIALNRSRTAFTDVERQVLTIMRQPLLDALLRVRAQSATDPDVDALPLTGQERRILQLVASGGTNAAIATAIGISPRTVAKHLEHIYRKLQVSNRAAAAARTRPESPATPLGAAKSVRPRASVRAATQA